MAGGAFRRCAAATTVEAACQGLTDDLVERGLVLPSVYLLVGSRLRCLASRGYFQVRDGFPPGVGVIGDVVGNGRTVYVPDTAGEPDFIAAIPGLRSEIGVPVRVDGKVVGAVNVESRQVLPPTTVVVVEEAAASLGQRITALGGIPVVSLSQRLAQAVVEMTSLMTTDDLTAFALESAMSLSGMPSAAIAFLDGRDEPLVCRGRMATAICAWGPDEIALMRGWVSAAMSSYFPGGEDIPAGFAFLRATGVRAISVHPLVVRGAITGLLVLVSDEAVPHAPKVVEVLEMLAGQTAASLTAAETVAELSRRAELDDLTGLGNTAAFSTDLRARCSDGSPRDTLVCIDVDSFKAVNDGFGHLAGDRLLSALATEMDSVLRGTDRLYRIGGDEFAALLTTVDSAETELVVHRLLEAARRVRTTVSIGTCALDAGDAEEVRRLADERLYVAKSRGRDRAELA